MSLVLAFVLAAAAPVTPTIIEPERNGQVVSGADVHMVTAPFSDPDGHGHRCTDWEIRRGDEVVWEARCVEGPEKIHIHMADGTFTGSSAGQRELTGGRFYRLLARQCDDSGDPATEWSAWAERTFLTSEPPVAQPMRLRDVTSPLWNVDGASLRIEQIDGVPLLRIENGLLLDEQPAASQSVVRLIVTAGESALKAPESELTFEDENARQRIIYLPSIQLEARQSAYFWVSANGSTHYAEAGSRAPNFDSIVRGAPVPWRVHERGFVVEKFATGLQLPVNIAFVANPRKENDAPFFYVAELYGDVKVVTRGGEVRDFATGLLDFDPTGAIPGSGESGLAGIAVDPESGDVFVTLVSWPDRSNRDLIPNVLRLRASDDGLKADAVELVLTLPGEKQSASHQISNITIGPDRKLYVHFGDSVRHDLAQDLSTVRGKIIRFNFDGTPAADNPFYDASDGISAKDYIFARGFRNPFGGAWRAADQSLYSIENGPI
ncbi:MAG: PQQ-dependent sugar dehydrogenase, partial [Thermoanaerobaculia bacterium]